MNGSHRSCDPLRCSPSSGTVLYLSAVALSSFPPHKRRGPSTQHTKAYPDTQIYDDPLKAKNSVSRMSLRIEISERILLE